MRTCCFLYFLLICMPVLGLLIGCGGPTATEKAAEKGSEKAAKTVVGVSLWKTDDPWHAQMAKDIESGLAKHPQINVVFKDANDDVEQQKVDVEQFLADRVNLIIISPKSSQTLTEPVAKAVAAGIPVIVVDRPLIGNQYTCWIRPDNKQIGTAAAHWLAHKLGGKGRIVEIKGPVDSIPNRERHEAFRTALLDPAYRFVHEGYVDPPKLDAARIMQESLESVAQIDAVYAFNDEAGKTAYEIAKRANREKGTLFVAIDGLPDIGRKFVSEGILDASFLRPTCGEAAVDAAIQILAGHPVPKSIVLDTRLFTKDNLPSGGEPVDARK